MTPKCLFGKFTQIGASCNWFRIIRTVLFQAFSKCSKLSYVLCIDVNNRFEILRGFCRNGYQLEHGWSTSVRPKPIFCIVLPQMTHILYCVTTNDPYFVLCCHKWPIFCIVLPQMAHILYCVATNGPYFVMCYHKWPIFCIVLPYGNA